MAVCQYFLQGKCNFGSRCRNEHPQQQASAFGQSSSQAILKGGGGGGGSSAFGGFNRFGALSGPSGGGNMAGGGAFGGGGRGNVSAFGQHAQSAFTGFGNKTTTTGGGGGGLGFSLQSSVGSSPFGQQKSAFDIGGRLGGGGGGVDDGRMVTTGRPGNKPVTVDQLRKLVKVPMVWKLSTFAPVGEKPSMVAGTDVSPEESRLEFVMAQRQQQQQQQLLGGGYNSVAEACQKYDQLVQDMDRRLGDIDGNAPAYATQWNQMHGGGAAGGGNLGTQSAFGQQASAFGQKSSAFGQQASAFGQQTSAFGGNIGGGSGSAFGSGSGSGSLSFLGGSKPSSSSTVTVASFGSTPQEIMEATGPRRDLTAEESGQFRAQAFVYGRIPEVAPTPELCSH
ncbi:Nucleoporin-like protein 2 [Coemansia sp. RSA 1939]|nr:Nucleoporin-like protein 2 [Coemansia sp. RSA 1939]